jgi:hypothetical protein
MPISNVKALEVQSYLENNYGFLWSAVRGRQLLAPYRGHLDDDTWERAIKAYCATNTNPPDAAKVRELIDGILRRRQDKLLRQESDKHYAIAENRGDWKAAIEFAREGVEMMVKKGMNRRNREDEKLIMKVLSHRLENMDEAEAVYEKLLAQRVT